MNAQKSKERYANDPEYREKERARSREYSKRIYKLTGEKTGPKARPAEERFWEKVLKGPDPDDCWEWQGANRRGSDYASLAVDGVTTPARRYSYELHFGPLTSEQYVRLGCRNKNCVNPKHLYLDDLDGVRNPKILGLTTEEALARSQANSATTRAHYQAHKEERQAYIQRYQMKNKIRAINYLGGQCQCGEEHPSALQFHHRDPSTKLFSITSKELSTPKKRPWDTITPELDKCDLVCANCHFKEHAVLSWDVIGELKLQVQEIQ
jgi:hypothetical protein